MLFGTGSSGRNSGGDAASDFQASLKAFKQQSSATGKAPTVLPSWSNAKDAVASIRLPMPFSSTTSTATVASSAAQDDCCGLGRFQVHKTAMVHGC